MVASAVKPYLPEDSPLWFVTAGFLLYFGISYLLIRYLEKHELFLGYESSAPEPPPGSASDGPAGNSRLRAASMSRTSVKSRAAGAPCR